VLLAADWDAARVLVIFSGDGSALLPWWTPIATMVEGDCYHGGRQMLQPHDGASPLLRVAWRPTSPELDAGQPASGQADPPMVTGQEPPALVERDVVV
jgi:hypothetical protein